MSAEREKTSKKAKKQQKKQQGAYYYLAAKISDKPLNTFLQDASEEIVLKCVRDLFTKYGRIAEFQQISSDNENMSKLFLKYFPHNKDDNKAKAFNKRVALQGFFRKSFMEQPQIKTFWSYFVFGFNAITRKLEKGKRFELLFVDKAISDATTVSHVRGLANMKSQMNLLIVAFSKLKLADLVSCDFRHFRELLMIGILSDGLENSDIANLVKLVQSKVYAVTYELSIGEDMLNKDNIHECAKDKDVRNGDPDKPTATVKKCPYVFVSETDEVHKFLISHSYIETYERPPSQSSAENVVSSGDYLKNLPRISGLPCTERTVIIHPPNQKKLNRLIKQGKKRKFNSK